MPSLPASSFAYLNFLAAVSLCSSLVTLLFFWFHGGYGSGLFLGLLWCPVKGPNIKDNHIIAVRDFGSKSGFLSTWVQFFFTV